MANCEKCGKQIEEGAVFCSACTGVLDIKLTTVRGGRTTETALEHEVFSFKARSSKLVTLKRLLPVVVCGFMAIIGLISITADTTSSEVSPMILFGGIMVVGVLVVILVARQSQQDPFLSLSIGLLILTFGVTQLLPDYSNLIFPIGITLVGFILVLILFRQADHNRRLSLALVIIILSLGMSMAFPEFTNFILALSFLLTGFLILIAYL